MRQTHKYHQDGWKHYVSGMIKTYVCRKCGNKKKYLIADLDLLEQRRERDKAHYQELKEENLSLRQRIREIHRLRETGQVLRQIASLQKHLDRLKDVL